MTKWFAPLVVISPFAVNAPFLAQVHYLQWVLFGAILFAIYTVLVASLGLVFENRKESRRQ